MKKQLKISIQLGLVFLISLLISSTTWAANKHAQPLDGIAAVVNDSIITQSELNQAIDIVKKQLIATNVTLPPDNVLHKQVLDQLINKKLQLALAKQMGINVSNADVDKTISQLAQSNNLPVTELYKKINAEGMSTSDYRKTITDEVTIQQVQQQALGPKITISPEEVNSFLHSKDYQAFSTQEYHLEDILITLPEAPSPQQIMAAKKRAADLLTKIRAGTESFSTAAASESGDKNAMQGGDLGWRKLAEVPTAFSGELVHMKPNDLMGPIQTANGFHILRLSGVRAVGKQLTEEERHTQVQQLLFQRKLEEAMQTWITKLRAEAFINTSPTEA